MLTVTVFIHSIIHYYHHIITIKLCLWQVCTAESNADIYCIYSFNNSLLLPYYHYQIVLVRGRTANLTSPHTERKAHQSDDTQWSRSVPSAP